MTKCFFKWYLYCYVLRYYLPIEFFNRLVRDNVECASVEISQLHRHNQGNVYCALVEIFNLIDTTKAMLSVL